MTIGLAGCSKEGNKVSNSDNNVSDTIAVSDENSGSSDLEETEDYFSEYLNKGYAYENLNIISSTLHMADDGNVYNKVKWYEEEENNFYKAKPVYEEDMYLNDEGIWDIGARGVTGTPELLEDKISGTYELHEPGDGSGSHMGGASSNLSISEIKEIIYAKNNKWVTNGKGIYNDKITLSLH